VERGPSTVRDVHQSLDHPKPVGGGSTLGLVLHALESTPATALELHQIRRLLHTKKGART